MSPLQTLAARVAQGEVLDDTDAALILASHDLIAIGMMADEVRRARHGTRTTFVRVFELHADAIPATLPAGVSAGEFRLVGRPETVDAACAAVHQARKLAGNLPLTGFSLSDLGALVPAAADTFVRLRTAGLDAVAEAPLDLVTGDVTVAARAAGLVVQRLTVDTVPADPLALLARARDLQASHGGFRAFAPLPRRTSISTPTTGYDDVKLVALARLMVRDVPSIQVDWPLYGPKLAQVALTVGADDVDGVAAVEAGLLGSRRSAIEEIKGNIRAAGQEPVERTGWFEVRAS